MTRKTSQHSKTLARLRVPLALTWAGMTFERAARALWPLWSLVIAVLGALMLGWHESFPIEAVWGIGVLSCIAALVFLVRGFIKFRLPSRIEALARLDGSLKGRPIQALMDSQAIGPQDAASAAVWRAHQARMATRAMGARAIKPSIHLAARDPFALRYVAALLLGVALIFGSLWRVASVTEIAQGGTDLAGGPVWEGWVEPPAYTGKPSLYLNDQDGRIEVPTGSEISLRLYGEIGALTVSETVSARIQDMGSAADPEQSFLVQNSGTLEVAGPNGRVWDIVVTPDTAPRVEVTGQPERSAEGVMSLPFSASDDYDVTGGTAVITLDLAAVERRYGFSVEPEPREGLELDLPLPISGDRRDFSETLFG
jgi:hypothetical protein